jgi:DNA-binding Xre family transcriptional regulator
MRGSTDRQMTMCMVVDPGELIPEQHPTRRVRPFVESALARLEPTFEEMYARVGRPSIPPEPHSARRHVPGAGAVSGTRIRVDVLHIELGKRGWHASDLARAAGVSEATLSAANRGARISPRTLRKIVEALNRQPVVPRADELIAG